MAKNRSFKRPQKAPKQKGPKGYGDDAPEMGGQKFPRWFRQGFKQDPGSFLDFASDYMQYSSPFYWMNQDDEEEAAADSQESQMDFISEFIESLQGMNPGQYPELLNQMAGGGALQGAVQSPYGAAQAPAGSPVAGASQGAQIAPQTASGLPQEVQDIFTSYEQMPGYAHAGGAGLAMANQDPAAATAPSAAPQAAPTSAPAGMPADQWGFAQKFGTANQVDPLLLAAIGKAETGWGEKGLGRKGLTLGYGAFDSGPSFQWAGPENQYRYGAEKLADWGALTLEDVLAGKAASWATDPKWESNVASIYKALQAQMNAAPQTQPNPMGGLDAILNGIERGQIDPKVLDTLGPELSKLADSTGKAADEAEAALGEDEEDEE